MSATYDPTLPTDKDHVRFLVGDTDTTSPQFQDEEILAVIADGTATGKAIKYFAAATLLSIAITVSVSSGHGVMDIRLSSLAINLGMAQSGIGAIESRIKYLQGVGAYYQAGQRPIVRGLGARTRPWWYIYPGGI
jgi:hypothetical protein